MLLHEFVFIFIHFELFYIPAMLSVYFNNLCVCVEKELVCKKMPPSPHPATRKRLGSCGNGRSGNWGLDRSERNRAKEF